MDAIDRKILQIVQTDSSLSIAAVAAKVGLCPDAVLEAHPALEAFGRHPPADRFA
jgi:DNA-binding Lrp family transcriptional regulator